MKVQSGSCAFNNCVFSDNYALSGGHIAVLSDSQVELNYCTLKNGGAVSNGGAIANNSFTSSCNIVGGEITGNQALDFGGGVSNAGTMNITGVKLYDNSAVNGGADIATRISGSTILTDTVEQLNELFSGDCIEITGWVCDYNFDDNIYIPDVDPNQKDALLKLQYNIIPEQSTEEPTETLEPGTDEGIEPTEPVEPSEPSIEETEKPTMPIDTETLTEQPGTGEGKEESGTATLSDTEKNSSGDVTTTDNSTSTNTTNNSSTFTNSSSSADSSTHNNVTNSDNRASTTDNSDHSRVTENNDSSDRSVVNNYYTTQSPATVQGQQSGNSEVIVMPSETTAPGGVGTADTSELGGQGQENQEQIGTNSTAPNIKIDAKGVDCVIEYNESSGYSISVNSGQAVTDTSGTEKNMLSWFYVVQIALLAAIFICLIWKPKNIRE